MPPPTIDEAAEAERLRQVRALVEDVLREHDVCASVILAGRVGRFENFTHLDATWCVVNVQQTPGGDAIRMRSKLADYGGDAERQRQELEWSVGVVSGFAEIGGRIALAWTRAARFFDRLRRWGR